MAAELNCRPQEASPNIHATNGSAAGYFIRILRAEKVLLEVSTYDLSTRRITFRRSTTSRS
jgi:translation initiation factor IF-1